MFGSGDMERDSSECTAYLVNLYNFYFEAISKLYQFSEVRIAVKKEKNVDFKCLKYSGS